MSINRFIKGVLKGDIANMQAEQARQAEEEKRKQAVEDRRIAFSMNLASAFAGKIDTSKITPAMATQLNGTNL